jgi:hypothetical protein
MHGSKNLRERILCGDLDLLSRLSVTHLDHPASETAAHDNDRRHS